LVFSASDDGEARQLRELFLPFARAVNEGLAECGFPLCDGGVMAGNPRWCLSRAEWIESFSGWVRTPEPEALLNAAIFFDFRPLHGDAGLAADLRRAVSDLTRGNEIFLRMMTVNALAASPPLGRLRDFAIAPEAGGSIDLKKFGSRIFVDAARILALGAGMAPPEPPSGCAPLPARAWSPPPMPKPGSTPSMRCRASGSRCRPPPRECRATWSIRRGSTTSTAASCSRDLRQARTMQQLLRARYHIEILKPMAPRPGDIQVFPHRLFHFRNRG
jgi:hypothetical protein